jgi:hypothetical protein
MATSNTFTAFLRDRRVASGSLAEVVRILGHLSEGRMALVFDDASGELVKLGRPAEVERALAVPAAAPTTLGMTLLPRHVAWLERQPGGPSAAVRRLIDAARRDGIGQARQKRDAAYRFMSMVAGDLAGFEEACRALYSGDADRFEAAAVDWPRDLRSYARLLAGDGMADAVRLLEPAG